MNLKNILAVLIGLVLLPMEAQAQECDGYTINMNIEEVTAGGEAAFAQRDLRGLVLHVNDAENYMRCMGEPITPAMAAAFHRLMALHGFVNKDQDRVLAELHAARQLQPGYSYKEALGTGHPLESLYEQAASYDPGPAQTIRVSDGYHMVGGVRGGVRYQNSPVILQAFRTPEGSDEPVLWKTVYLKAGQDLPEWAVAPDLPTMQPRQRPDFLTRPWFYYAASGALGLAAAGSYGVSRTSYGQYIDPSTPTGDLEGLETRTNTWATTSVIFAGGAAAALIPAVTFTFGKKGKKPSAELAHK